MNIRHVLILQLGQAVEEEVMIENRRKGSVASPYACEMEMLRLNIRIDFGYLYNFIFIRFYFLFTSTSIIMYMIYTDPNSQGLQNSFKIWVTFNLGTFEKRKNGSARTGLRCSSEEGRQ